MSALPRPDIATGPQLELVDALHNLHHRAGWPSLRTLAREAGCSHTTVSSAFSSPRLPRWGVLELLVEAMGGDVGSFRDLWLAASSPEPTAPSASSPQIAGRLAELVALRRHLLTGRGLLLVTGEAGIGKTKLVSTAVALRDGHPCVASGACLPLATSVPLLPVAELLRSVYEVDHGQWLKEAFAECAPYVPDSLTRLVPELAPLAAVADIQDGWSAQRLFSAIASTLEAAAVLRPLALVLEDLHWADATTLDLVEHLISHGLRFPLVGTWRLDDLDTPTAARDWSTRVQRSASVQTLELGPLTQEESGEQLRILLGESAAPRDLVATIHGRTLGQPLFTEQLAAHGSGGDDQLPRLLGDLLDRRIEGLSPSAWQVARCLGVADRPLPHSLVEQASGQAATVVTAGLQQLAEARLLKPDADGLVQLRHPLLAEAVRRRLVPGESQEAHRSLAVALTEQADPPAAEVATHWRRAEDASHELDWRIRAAQQAAARFAPRQEAEEWVRALQLWVEDDETQGALPVSRARACFAAMTALEASGQLERAHEIAEGMLGSVARLAADDQAELYQLAADYRGHVDGGEAGLELCTKAVTILSGLPPSVDLIRALRTRAGLLRDASRWLQGEADIEEAIKVNQVVGDVRQQRRLLAEQGWYDLAAGRHPMALDRLAAASRPLAEPDPHGDIYTGLIYSDVLLDADASLAEVAAAARPALEAAEHWDIDSALASQTRAVLATALLRAGATSEAAALVDPRTDGAATWADLALHAVRAEIDTRRGQLDQALHRATGLMTLSTASAERDTAAEALASAALWGGRPQLALDQLRVVLDQEVDTEDSVYSAPSFVLAARAAADLARTQQRTSNRSELHLRTSLVALLRRCQVDPFAWPRGPTPRVAHAATWNAELARLANDQTVEIWATAAARWTKLNRPHDAAYCRWRAAQVALAAGRATLGARLLRRARTDARGHDPLLLVIQQAAMKS